MPSLGLSTTKAGGIVSSYERDGLVAYYPFNSNSANDMSTNTNNGTIKSGRALAFDGVVDYLENTSPSNLPSGNTFTISAWVNYSGTSGEWVIWRRDENNDNPRFGLNASNRRILLGKTGRESGTADTNLVADTWNRIVVSVDNKVATFYLNGLADGTHTFTVGNDGDFTHANEMRIGEYGSTYIDGNISDLQVWDAAWSATDVQNDYTHPEMLAHTFSGTSLTESNLKLWYPMTEGNPESPQTTIFDGSPKVLGDNPTAFSSLDLTSGDWNNTGSGYSSATANTITTSGAAEGGFYANSSNTTNVIGKVYKCTLDATTTSSGGFQIRNAGNSDIYLAHASTSNYSDSFYFTATHAQFYIRNQAGGTLTINSISVQEVQRGNHATSVFYGDELVANGDHDSTLPTINSQNLASYDVASFALSSDQASTATYNGASAGSNSIKVTADSDSTYPLIRFLDGTDCGLVTGKTYQVSCYVYLPASQEMDTVYIQAINNGGSTIDLGVTATTTTTNTWVRLYGSYVSDDPNKVLEIRGQESGGGDVTVDNEIFYVDQISIKEVGLSTTGHVEGQETIFQPAFVGQSRKKVFGDTATYAEINTDILDIQDGKSISLWFNPQNEIPASSASDYGVLIGSNNTNSNIHINSATQIQMRDDTSGVEFTWTVPTMSVGEWYHIAVVFDDDRYYTLYLNGSFISTQDNDAFSGLNVDRIGGSSGGAEFQFDGIIDEISYWTKELTLADVTEIYNDGVPLDLLTHSSTTDLVHYWRNNNLDSNGKWEDLKGSNYINFYETNKYEIILPEGTTSGRDINGFILTHPNNNYLSLDGTTGCYVDIPNNSSLNFGTGDFTVEFWARYYKDGYMGLVSKGVGSADAGWEVVVNLNDGKILGRIEGPGSANSTTATSGSQYNDGLWHHIVAVYDRSANVTLYIDKVADGTVDITAVGDCDATHSLDIGRQTSENNPFDGQIDDVRIYNKALTTAEIVKNYRHGKAKHKD